MPKHPPTIEEQEKKALKLRLENERREFELIEYNKFPTILGWYFDGCFVQHYSLNDEYAEYFTEIEEEREAVRDFDLTETFTEKAHRNFWPPKFRAGCFRTRGVYLDFPECVADPPVDSHEFNFERQKVGIGNKDDDSDANTNDNQGDKPTKFLLGDDQGKGNLKNNWYWDEDLDDFLPKVPEHEYFFDEADKVYKQKITTDSTPYDWYFDDHDGKYYRRDRDRPQDYDFNHVDTVYKKKNVTGPSVNGMIASDYFYDEKDMKWYPKNKNDASDTEYYPQGHRKIKKGPRGRSSKTPDDFYYDSSTGQMKQKEGNEKAYKFDPIDEMWKKDGDPYSTKTAEFCPQDFKFDKEDGVWKPKREAELKKMSPYDFYFDDSLGRYFPRDKNHRDLYEFDHKLNVWKLKGAKGPSANHLTNLDYYFNEKDCTWQLLTGIDPDDLDFHEAGLRKVLVGDRGRLGKTDDDYYYDVNEGKFLPKNHNILSDYYYDTDAEIFRKLGQPLTPSGSNKRKAKDYYYDKKDGQWLPSIDALNAPKPEPKPRTRPELTAYDFCFNDTTGLFEVRNLATPEYYKYHPSTGVYHKLGTKGPSLNEKMPGDYYFDENDGMWNLKSSEKGNYAEKYPNGHRQNIKGPRGRTGLIPDDLYFDTMEGVFLRKDAENPGQYEYDPQAGIWKIKGCPPGPGPNQLKALDYYWDDEAGEFLLKHKLKCGELARDANTNLWKIKRRRPKDYFWDLYPGKWQRKQIKPSGDDMDRSARKKILREAQKKAIEVEEEEEEHDINHPMYDKPWLHNFPHLAADKHRQEMELQRKEEHENAKKLAKENKAKEAQEQRAQGARERKEKELIEENTDSRAKMTEMKPEFEEEKAPKRVKKKKSEAKVKKSISRKSSKKGLK